MDKLLKWAIPALQMIISAVLMFTVVKSGLFPNKYLGIAAAVILVLLLITVLLTRCKIVAVRTIGNILAIFMSGMLVFATVYVNQVVKTLNSIAGSDTEFKSIAVFVKENNAAYSIDETGGYCFGVFKGADTGGAGRADGKQIDETLEVVKQSNTDAELITKEYDTLTGMAEALLGGEIEAAVCNKAYKEILEEVIVDFPSDTRILYEKEFESSTVVKAVESDESATNGPIEEVKTPESRSIMDQPFNVLISGIDVSGPISTTSRSDVNIVMTVNPLTHKILLTTTPRDYYVYIPGISGDMRDKLTHAGIYGVKSSMKTLEDLYDIEISDYIRINFDSLVQLVDALGGIDVYSEYEFESEEFYFRRGTNHLNGEEALAFSRERDSFDSGDRQRGRNQMLVLTAIIDKMLSPALLKNPSGVLDVVGRSMQTSIGSSEITDAIAWQLDTGADWSIDRQSVTGTGDSQPSFSMSGMNVYVMWPNEDSVSQASEEIREVMEDR